MSEGHFQASLVASGQAALPVRVDPNAKIPIQYEQAIKALEACQTIDEARYFDNKADALAAWAKIYNDDRAATAARVLKLHAYRRIGALAEQIRPANQPENKGAFRKGSRSVLMSSGFNHNQSVGAIAVARMPAKDFERVVAQKRPPAPSTLVHADLRKNPEAARLATRFTGLLSFFRKVDVAALVAGMDARERQASQKRVDEMRTHIQKLQAALSGK